MTSLTIDPRNRPLRGIRAIAEYIGQHPNSPAVNCFAAGLTPTATASYS